MTCMFGAAAEALSASQWCARRAFRSRSRGERSSSSTTSSTGRTIRSAIDALLEFGRPARVQLAVLVDQATASFDPT